MKTSMPPPPPPERNAKIVPAPRSKRIATTTRKVRVEIEPILFTT